MTTATTAPASAPIHTIAATVPRLLHSIPDARHILGGIGNATLYEMLAAGELDGVHIGRRHLITDASIRALLARRMAPESTTTMPMEPWRTAVRERHAQTRAEVERAAAVVGGAHDDAR